MKPTTSRGALLLFVALLWTESAKAHGIAGNRYFDGTMTFDDPAVADEAIVPTSHISATQRRAVMWSRTASIGPSRASSLPLWQ
jgi:hypothetical protein